MYYFLYSLYVISSTAIGLWVFWWALKNGQFKDQERARFLPLQSDTGVDHPEKVSKFHRYQAYVVFGLLFVGLLAGATVVFYALIVVS